MHKRVWYQEHVAHSGRVLCARLGDKSGQVLATGGDDKRVNIWKVSKPNAMMSLTGHSTAVECVVFDKQEEVLVVGCSAGSMQVWNLEYRKMAGTLPGHRTACSAVEFHPYGEFFASGSADTNLKIWDLRRKSCIQTYKGHTGGITSIRFSPHGRWVATGGQDSVVKIWDLTAGKLMRDLDEHRGPITSLAFHPKEFLLASGSADRTMKLWSLETFNMKAGTELGPSPIQAVKFWGEEKCVLVASQESLRVYGQDALNAPLDEVPADWRNLQDCRLCLPEEKLLAISTDGSQYGIWVADLKREAAAKGTAGYRPLGRSVVADPVAKAPPQGASQRRPEPASWAAEHEDTAPVEAARHGDGRHRPEEARPAPPEADAEGTPSRRGRGGDAVARLDLPPPPARAVASPSRLTGGASPLARAADHAAGPPAAPVGEAARGRTPLRQEAQAASPSHAGIGVSPKAAPAQHFHMEPARSSSSTCEVAVEGLNQVSSKHAQMMGVLQRRQEQARKLKELWVRGNVQALSGAVDKDAAVFCDFARAVMQQRLQADLNLDACQTLLQIVQDLMGSKYEDFVATAVQFAEVLLSNFGQLISETRVACGKTPEWQLDLPREERLRKCNACYSHFQEIHRLLPDGSASAGKFGGVRGSLQRFLQGG